ncbi:DUF948 domain-containing protein [Paenibacillus swuensis]|uniref:DUF948 domain-containing protein n=1 Tax=Paenibacillus swuensis TaxID=1178515 RepID=UPI000839017A|nr:DUF948 domain-containing protein [Paenibacillus swuensis]
MLTQVSVAVIAVAFAILVVFLIKTLKKVMESLEQTNRTLTEVQHTVNDLTVEAKQLMHTVNQITVDVKGKINSVEPFFETAQDVGEVLHGVTNSVKQVTAAVLGETGSGQRVPTTGYPVASSSNPNILNRVSSIASYVSLGSRIINRWQNNKVKSTM